MKHTKRLDELERLHHARQQGRRASEQPWPIRDDEDRFNRLELLLDKARTCGCGLDSLTPDELRIVEILTLAKQRMDADQGGV